MINKIKDHKKKIKKIFRYALDQNSSIQIVHNRVVNMYSNQTDIHVVAIGKSAPFMLDGAIKALGSKFSDALLITKIQCGSEKFLSNSNIETIIAGHPIPDENSLLAGEKLVLYVKKLQKQDSILFLISGGTSSLVEYIPDRVKPLISITDIAKVNKWLLANDKNIIDVNTIRKKISGIKAGRLLNYIKCDTIHSLYISDVPNDCVTHIGSGLLIPEDKKNKFNELPHWIEKLIKLAESIATADIKNKKIISDIVFSNSVLRQSIINVAKNTGYSETHNMDEFVSGNTIREAHRIGRWLKKQEKGLYVWGAETHMVLPDHPGMGGRNQSFALALAKELQNSSNVIVLLAGTDGNDGNTTDAGAIIDGKTIERGERKGVSFESCLNEANAGVFLSASGDLLSLGTTGTNVMDIIMALIWD
ncbi:MAG: DUF4147 domain-containing protein [Gammaproteobacteria bacterium]